MADNEEQKEEQIKTYSVSYKTDDSGKVEGMPKDETGKKAGAYTVTSQTPSRSGYSFSSWTISPGDSKLKAGAKYSIESKDITFTATWDAVTDYTVTYMPGVSRVGNVTGMPAPSTVSVALNTTHKVSSSAPSRSGYVFSAWKCSIDSKKTYKGGDTVSNPNNIADITLTAQWTIKKPEKTANKVTTGNSLVLNAGSAPLVSYNFMLRVEGIYDLPSKSVKAFTKENEYEYIQEGGQNDYVHMRRKPISKPFTLEVERYVGVDYFDPLPNGAEPILPIILGVSRDPGSGLWQRTYTFTGCIVVKKTYGELNAEKPGLIVDTTTIAYREMLLVDIPYGSV
jgi:uncharacterized repeat protein (TIGR02543 family)